MKKKITKSVKMTPITSPIGILAYNMDDFYQKQEFSNAINAGRMRADIDSLYDEVFRQFIKQETPILGKKLSKRDLEIIEISMEEIEKNGYNLNISRYVSTSQDEIQIDLKEVNNKLNEINQVIKENKDKHNVFLKELGLNPI
jgi:type I restriction-modification system DNA methylase subunit